jgi:hypothetical protein
VTDVEGFSCARGETVNVRAGTSAGTFLMRHVKGDKTLADKPAFPWTRRASESLPIAGYLAPHFLSNDSNAASAAAGLRPPEVGLS